jgi:hypothetical protein
MPKEISHDLLLGLALGIMLSDDDQRQELGHIDPLAFGPNEEWSIVRLYQAMLTSEVKVAAWFKEFGVLPQGNETIEDALIRHVKEQGERRRIHAIQARMPRFATMQEFDDWLLKMRHVIRTAKNGDRK